MEQDDAINTDEAAKILGIPSGTLRQWRCQKRGPAWFKYDGTRGAVRYSRAAVVAWRDSRRVVVSPAGVSHA